MGRVSFIKPVGIGFLLCLVQLKAATSCRSIEWARIENQKDLTRLEGVCEVRKSLAIFTTDVKKIVLPHLKKTGLINIDADGLEAIAFPALSTAREIYVKGPELRVAEFPQLKQVRSRLVFDKTQIAFLNFSKLDQVGRLIIQNCPQLEFVFSDNLIQLGSIWLGENPLLSEVCKQRLLANTQVISVQEMSLFQEQKRSIEAFKKTYYLGSSEMPIRPTGHPTHFDSFGMIVNHYYKWYPYEYSRYVGYVGPWGFSWLYW